MRRSVFARGFLPLAVSCLVVFVAFIAPSHAAEPWPNRPVKMLVPFTAGGTADLLGRIAAHKLSQALGQEFIVENKPGAGGLIAAEEAARAAPDGYTLVVSGIGGFIIAAAANPNTSVDILKDFKHIAYFGGPPSVLVVNPQIPAKSLKELVAYAKSHGQTLNYGSPALTAHANLIAQMFQEKAGIRFLDVPYKGASQAITDLIGGHLAVASMTLTSAAGAIKGGKARALAISAAARLPEYSDIPTYKEQGYADLVADTWFSLSGPAHMPPDIVKRINAEVVKGFQDPEIRARLAKQAIDPTPYDVAGFNAFFKAETDRWTPIAQSVAKRAAAAH
jgi:tripartite-type tricarboxylate transporter receptor subunit TctC